MLKKLLLILALSLPLMAGATVTTKTITVSYTCGIGSTGPFQFTFPISDPTAMTVTLNNAVLVPSAYTIVPVNNSYDNGGSVTLIDACTISEPIKLSRITPILQTSAFRDNMPNPMKSFELGLDKVTEIEQEITQIPLVSASCPAGQVIQTVAPLICVDNTAGSAGNPAAPAFAVNFANSSVSAFQGDPNITINPTTHALSAPVLISSTSPAYNVTSAAYCDITAGCAANYTVTTDSCPAINHAAAAAQAAGGGVVLFPAVASGYACGTQLNFAGYSNVTLQCQIQSGAGTPCRIFWNRTDSTTMINEVGASNVKIQGIQVLGQSPSFNGYLVDISGTQNASIVDDFFEGYFGGTNTKGICLNCANSGGGGDTQSSDTYIFNTSFDSLTDALQMPSAGLVYYSNIVHLAQNKFLGPFAKAALQLGGANIVIDGNNHFESIAASGGIYSATYISGGTFPTTGPCTLSAFNHGSTGAIASIAVSGGTPGAITIYYGGTGATSAPTTATLSGSGCSGTVTLTTVSTPDVHSSVAGAFAATTLGLNGFAFNNNWVADGFTGTIGDFSALTGGLSTAFSFFASGNELDDSTTVFKLSPWMQNVIIQGNFFDNCTNSYDLNGLTATSDDLYTTLILQPTECANQYVGTPNPAAAGFFYAADGSIAPTALTLPGGTKMTGSIGNGGFAQETTNASKISGHAAAFDANGNTVDSGVVPTAGSAFQVNGTPLTSSSTVNFQAGTNITLTNPSAGNILVTASATAATAFSALTSATNTTAAMLCGAGCTLGPTSTGVVTANALSGTPSTTLASATQDICTVTIALPTGSIAPGGWSSVTGTCTNALTTDVVKCTPTATFHGVTGYDVTINSGNVLTIDPPYVSSSATITIGVGSSVLNSWTGSPGAMSLKCAITR